GLNVRNYVRLLEQAVIDTVARFNVHAHRYACAIGVWVGGEQTEPDPAACESNPTRSGSKLAAVGVRVQRWISMHGLALNVDPDMSHFNLIVPCGLAGRPVTSLAQILGDHCPSMQMVKDALRESLAQHLLTLPTVPAPPKPTP
ncbi:MAG: lipoyl(octanoyl) transferase LipB, partial [Phycisphaeraceae bacterium]